MNVLLNSIHLLARIFWCPQLNVGKTLCNVQIFILPIQ